MSPPTMRRDIVGLDATALSSAIHRRELSCVEVLNAYLAQIEEFNPAANALVDLQPRQALHDLATERDAQLARRHSMGVMHGFPQAPKDLLPAAGMRTTRGSPIFAEHVSQSDAFVFERMRASGALFVARSNSPEFGLGGNTYNTVYGTTHNAFDPTLTAGGSSGGAAVAVALQMLPAADGSDMMGSLRTPAAFNHVFGLRPSMGCIANGPAEEAFFQQFSVTGPMARNVPDLALLLGVQAGYDVRAPLSGMNSGFDQPLQRDFSGIRVGWLGDCGGRLPMEKGLLSSLEDSLRHFRALGAHVEVLEIQFDLESLWGAWLDLRSFTFANSNEALYASSETRRMLKPEAVWEIERGLRLTGSEVFRASKARTAWYAHVVGLFEQYDFLVLPATQVMPFPAHIPWPRRIETQEMDTYHRWLQVVLPATMAGLPALSVPAGLSAGGIPMGLQILGPPRADFATLQLGHAYDQAGGFSRVRSPLLERLAEIPPGQ